MPEITKIRVGTTTYDLKDTVYSVSTGLSLSGTTLFNEGILSVTSSNIQGNIKFHTRNNQYDIPIYGLKSSAFVDTDYFYSTTQIQEMFSYSTENKTFYITYQS